MMNVEQALKSYIPKNEQETVDKKAMLDFIEKNDNYLVRDNLIGHFTSSAIILNEDLSKVLFAYHKIYDSWAWVGGHNDGFADCLTVAMKEAQEETGLVYVKPLTENIAGIDIIYVMPHIKHGKYVSDHLHLNLTYILIADESASIRPKLDENTSVKWFDIEDVFNHITEPRMKPIYQKMLAFALTYRKGLKK